MPSSENTPLRVWPDFRDTVCQRSEASLPAASVRRGRESDMVVRWVFGVVCIAVENPGTIAASSAPMVANRLACAQCRRVQRP